MFELLNIENVTVVGVLLVACVYLVKSNDAAVKELSKRHTEEEERLLEEYKEIKEERKIERKEWLEALGKNTQELNNIARRLEIIPNLQQDVDTIKNDMLIIKTKIGSH
jgi:thioester reductase-like protein